MTDEDDRQETRRTFEEAVNMSPRELENWLQTEESQEVGQTRDGEAESVGHQSGRRIVAIKRKRKDELSDADYAHMRKAIGYVRRHAAQPPKGDIRNSRWRYSLMNWGHDPLKR